MQYLYLIHANNASYFLGGCSARSGRQFDIYTVYRRIAGNITVFRNRPRPFGGIGAYGNAGFPECHALYCRQQKKADMEKPEC